MKTRFNYLVTSKFSSAMFVLSTVLILGYFGWWHMSPHWQPGEKLFTIEQHSDDLSGTLYFEASNFILDGRPMADASYAYTYDLSTGELHSEKIRTFGMMHQPLADGRSSLYEFNIGQWQGVQNNSGRAIPFADGGQLVIYENGKRSEIFASERIDFHEFEVTPEGNYVYLRSDFAERYQDSTLTCLPTCAVLYQTIIEATPDGNILTEISLLDAYQRDDVVMDDMLIIGNTMLYDVTHANSVQINSDGYLVSIRHTNEVIQYSHDGDMLWRSRDYEIDNPFSHQHDAQLLKNGNLLLFDNGNGTINYSRGIEYAIDHTTQRMVTVWQYDYNRHFAPNRGSIQRLSDGSTLMNFVDAGIVLVDADENVLLEIAMPQFYASYQARIRE